MSQPKIELTALSGSVVFDPPVKAGEISAYRVTFSALKTQWIGGRFLPPGLEAHPVDEPDSADGVPPWNLAADSITTCRGNGKFTVGIQGDVYGKPVGSLFGSSDRHQLQYETQSAFVQPTGRVSLSAGGQSAGIHAEPLGRRADTFTGSV
jgi:hypothetical protein